MAIPIHEFAESLVYTPPARPAPINVVAVFAPGRDEYEFVWRKRKAADFAAFVRRQLASRVADILMEKCAPFVETNLENGTPSFRLEVFLSDRGAYENWLPVERKQGGAEAVKRYKDRLPYGVDPDRIYE